jgi:hypothetical protein
MGSNVICTSCRSEIPLPDVNVSTDVALCRRCGKTWSYADLLAENAPVSINLQTPPKGVWLEETSPQIFAVGTSTRSAVAFFLVPFMCVWSGFSLGGIYGTQIANLKFNLIQSLFGIPFLIGTVVLGSVALMSVCGKVEVRVDGESGVVFTGVGPIGWRRRFNWRKVTAIRVTDCRNRRGYTSRQITLDGETKINFASSIKEERLDFLFAVLRKKWHESGH